MSAMPDATSLDQPVSSEDTASQLGDFIEDERVSDTPDTVMREMETDQLEAIERLPDRARRAGQALRPRRSGARNPRRAGRRARHLARAGQAVAARGERILKAGEYGRVLRDAVA